MPKESNAAQSFRLGGSLFFPLSPADEMGHFSLSLSTADDESLCLANYVTCRHGCSVAANYASPPLTPEDTSVLLRQSYKRTERSAYTVQN